MITKELLVDLYVDKKKSVDEIAKKINCSAHKVRYWMDKHNLLTRSISEAIYIKHNPNGDPFKFKEPQTIEEAKLYGLGLGLYWGEGTKANKDSVRLGNTDPKLIKSFIKFLVDCFSVKKDDMKFFLQIFSDIKLQEAIDFWVKELKIKPTQLYRPTITKSQSIGTYRKKSRYGVMSVYYHNKKLRDLLNSKLPT